MNSSVILTILFAISIFLLVIWKVNSKKIYNLIMFLCCIVFIFFLAQYILDQNILNLGDKSNKIINNIKKDDARKQTSTLSVNSIKQMVMRQAQQGLEKQGFVAIPSRYILLPIYNDAYHDKGLNAGANYANQSADDPEGKNIPIMGQGNYGLAAHNFNDGKTGFSALQESTNHDTPYLDNGKLKGSSWLNGNEVILANDKGIYRYVINNQKTVQESEVSVLDKTNQPQLTIISCLFPSTNYRIITTAKLTDQYTWEKAPKKLVALFNLKIQDTNAHASWWNPGTEEGANGDAGGTKDNSKNK